MIEMIRTFYGRVCGLHIDKRTVVVESVAWFCPKCKKVWLGREEATSHNCKGKKDGNTNQSW